MRPHRILDLEGVESLLPAEAIAVGEEWSVWDSSEFQSPEVLVPLDEYLEALIDSALGRLRDVLVGLQQDVRLFNAPATDMSDASRGREDAREAIEDVLRVTVKRGIASRVSPQLAIVTLNWVVDIDEQRNMGEEWLGAILSTRDLIDGGDLAGGRTGDSALRALNVLRSATSLFPI